MKPITLDIEKLSDKEKDMLNLQFEQFIKTADFKFSDDISENKKNEFLNTCEELLNAINNAFPLIWSIESIGDLIRYSFIYDIDIEYLHSAKRIKMMMEKILMENKK